MFATTLLQLSGLGAAVAFVAFAARSRRRRPSSQFASAVTASVSRPRDSAKNFLLIFVPSSSSIDLPQEEMLPEPTG